MPDVVRVCVRVKLGLRVPELDELGVVVCEPLAACVRLCVPLGVLADDVDCV